MIVSMTKRILDAAGSDFNEMAGRDLLNSIRGAEGRTIVAEIVTPFPPLLHDISNPELAAAFGSDMILLNFYDVNAPIVRGLPAETGKEVVRVLKRLIGRPIGINLEPVDEKIQVLGERLSLRPGRQATPENAEKALEQGIDFIVLTGNPKTGVTNEQIVHALTKMKAIIGDKIVFITGKMHAAGTLSDAGSNIIDSSTIEKFITAGSDVILLPAPGTVPGITTEYIKEMVDLIHRKGALAMVAIGTSQEGADENTIRTIALQSKMTGADIHHLGDAGYSGIAIPENIMAYSIAIRGKRHTYRRMAMSVNR